MPPTRIFKRASSPHNASRAWRVAPPETKRSSRSSPRCSSSRRADAEITSPRAYAAKALAATKGIGRSASRPECAGLGPVHGATISRARSRWTSARSSAPASVLSRSARRCARRLAPHASSSRAQSARLVAMRRVELGRCAEAERAAADVPRSSVRPALVQGECGQRGRKERRCTRLLDRSGGGGEERVERRLDPGARASGGTESLGCRELERSSYVARLTSRRAARRAPAPARCRSARGAERRSCRSRSRRAGRRRARRAARWRRSPRPGS